MSARAWRGRKPGSPYRTELRLTQAQNRARRNPGRWVRVLIGGITGICYDELGQSLNAPLYEATTLWSNPEHDVIGDVQAYIQAEKQRLGWS